ncbi:TPA: hypothetical protein JN003_000508 [Shigella boydii]|nr:hypothetical protein [Shigella boydii]
MPGFSLAFAGLFISEFHSASHAHINESLSVSEPEKCRERDYFTLRERIVTVTKQVGYLQEYIRTQCLN